MVKFVVFIAIIITCLLTGCRSGFGNPASGSDTGGSYIHEPANSVLMPSSPLPATDKEMMKKYEKMERFEYSLKESYESRRDISDEFSRIESCYIAFEFGKDENIVREAKKLKDELQKQLLLMAEDIPWTEEEIEQRKVNAFYGFCRFRDDDLLHATQDYEYFVEKGHDADQYGHRPDKEKIASNYEYQQLRYETAEEARVKYESGEITIDEALEMIGMSDFMDFIP